MEGAVEMVRCGRTGHDSEASWGCCLAQMVGLTHGQEAKVNPRPGDPTAMGTMARRQGVQVLLGRVKFALCVICPSGDVKQVTGHEFGVWGSGWREGFGVYQPISGTENHGVGWMTQAECLEREEAEAQDPGLSFQQAVEALSLGAGLAMPCAPFFVVCAPKPGRLGRTGPESQGGSVEVALSVRTHCYLLGQKP